MVILLPQTLCRRIGDTTQCYPVIGHNSRVITFLITNLSFTAIFCHKKCKQQIIFLMKYCLSTQMSGMAALSCHSAPYPNNIP